MENNEKLSAAARLALPSVEHKLLETLAGSWNTLMTLYPAPGSQPVKSDIKCERKWLIGGRYLEEKLMGKLIMMNMSVLEF